MYSIKYQLLKNILQMRASNFSLQMSPWGMWVDLCMMMQVIYWKADSVSERTEKDVPSL